MKSSDLKVVAIILSIALFFTIITSNAVSIASVVILAKGGTGTATQTAAPQGTGTATNTGSTGYVDSGSTGNSVATTPDAGTVVTPDAGSTGSTATTPSGSTATTPSASTPTTPSGSTPTTPSGSTTNTDANDPIIKDPLGAYQKAAKAINQNGVAGYDKIGWQTILKIEGLGFLDGAIKGIIANFMTTEEEAEVKVNPKGSDDAKNRMPASNCSKGAVKSATAKKLADGNYEVVIILNEQTNPSYADPDGLSVMSREFLDYADVEKEVKNISIVKSLEGEIKYVDYTITAVMTKDGKFVSITHRGVGYIKANLNGSLNANGELEFNAKYSNFKY